MGKPVEIVFLGINDAGMQVYEWLCDRENVFVHSLLTTKSQLQVIKDADPDYVVSCGYKHIVPESILEIPNQGSLNLHPSYLPYNRGANPNVWSIVEGTPSGVSLHYMDTGIDTGDIVARESVKTNFSDTGQDLHERLEDAQVKLFKEMWPKIESGTVSTIKQEDTKGTFHHSQEVEELCELNPAEEIRVDKFLNRLRALTYPPYKNAKIRIDDETYYVEVDISKA
jgi:methionyl-tRNA formyltransferase